MMSVAWGRNCAGRVDVEGAVGRIAQIRTGGGGDSGDDEGVDAMVRCALAVVMARSLIRAAMVAAMMLTLLSMLTMTVSRPSTWG